MQIPGFALRAGAETFVVPPLALGDVERLQERLEAFKGGIDKASISTVIDALHAALMRNYPDMTRDRAAQLVGLENMVEVMLSLMNVSGMQRQPGEEKNQAAQPESPAGPPSTPVSAPIPAGPASTAAST